MRSYRELESILKEFPLQWVLGFRRTEASLRTIRKSAKKPAEIVVVGMGGSLLPGKLLESFGRIEKAPFRVRTWNTYGLPADITNDSLVIAISYSGNTEETISAFDEARRKRIPLAAVTTGGTLAARAKRFHLPWTEMPEACAPRFAMGYLFGALLAILVQYRLIRSPIAVLERSTRRINGKRIMTEGKLLAGKLKNRIPLVYTQEEWFALGDIWKLAFNETSKRPAFSWRIPELNHNEMEAFASGKNAYGKYFAAFFLEDPSAPKNIKERFRLTRTLFQSRAKMPTVRIPLRGTNFFEKALFGTLLGCWTSYFTAVAKNINPVKNRTIEEFKRRMKRALIAG